MTRDTRVSDCAFRALLQAGPTAEAAVPALSDQLRHGSADEQRLALDVLVQIGPGARAAVPALIGSLRAGTAHRWLVLETLGRTGDLGDHAAAAAGELTPLLDPASCADDPNRTLIPHQARAILCNLDEDPTARLAELTADWSSPYPAERSASLRVIGLLTADRQASMLPQLLQLLADDDAHRRLLAVAALGQWRQPSPQVRAALVAQARRESDPAARAAARHALEQLERTSRRVAASSSR